MANYASLVNAVAVARVMHDWASDDYKAYASRLAAAVATTPAESARLDSLRAKHSAAEQTLIEAQRAWHASLLH